MCHSQCCGQQTHPVLPCILRTLSGKAELEGKAQTKVVVAVVGRVVVPIRHTTVPGIVVPTATTVHAVRASTDALLL